MGSDEPRPPISSARLSDWRVSGRHDERALLIYDHTRRTPGRPSRGSPCLFAHPETLGCIFVAPDVNPFIQGAELGVPSADERRELRARLNLCRPALDQPRYGAGREGVL